MVKFKEITVGVRRLINLGNYENVTYECTATVLVEEGLIMSDVTRDEAYEEALAFCKAKVGIELERFTPKGKKS